MGTRRQTVQIPLVHGLGGDTDPRMRPPGRLSVARNVRAPEVGTLGTRYGFTELANTIAGSIDTIADQGPVRLLGTTQRELLAVGHRSLYSWSPDLAGWLYRGHVSPCCGRQVELYRSTADYGLADSACYGDVVVHAARRQERRESGGTWSSIECRLALASTGAAIGQPVQLDGSATTTIPWGPACATFGYGVVVIYAEGSAIGLHDLKRIIYDGTTPTSGPALYDTIAAADLPAASDDGRIWDVLGMANGTYVVAWIDNAQNVQLRLYTSSTHAVAATKVIEGNFYRVALAQQCIEAEADPNARELYVAVEEGGEGHTIQLFKRHPTTLDPVAGPKLIRTLGPSARAQNLGCASGIDHTDVEAVAVSWMYLNLTPAPDVRQTESNYTNNALTSLGSIATAYNAVPLTRPWWHRNRCYTSLQTVHPDMIAASGFESHMIADHEIATGANRKIKIAGMWGVGAAIGSATQHLQGSANHVWLDGTTHRFLTPLLAEVVKATSDTWLTTIVHRVAYDEIQLEFDAVPAVCSLGRSMAVIGGGYVSIYDGMSTVEMGFACPPLFHTAAPTGAGTEPQAGTHNYSAVWISQRGEMIHRGLPSPPYEVVLAAPENVLLSVFTLPATRRSQPDAQMFRAGGDLVPRRLNRVGEIIDGSLAAVNTWALTDDYAYNDLYIPLYTTGGVLEAVAPEGAKYPVIIRGRLLLLDFFRGDRLQYSKELAPGAAGELAVAPELYEALGRMSADGSPLVAAVALGFNTVVFSTSAIYMLSGMGPDGRGVGDDVSPLVEVQAGSGCDQPRSVVSYPDGVLFRGARGICRIDQGQQVTPIGGAVQDLTDAYPVVTSAVLMPTEYQVRFTVATAAEDDGRVLVYDYRIGEWFEWRITDGNSDVVVPRGAVLSGGIYYVLSANDAVWWEDTSTHLDAVATFVPTIVETAEAQPAGPQAWMRVGMLSLLGEYLDPHGVTISLYYDGATVAASSHTWTAADIEALPDPAAHEVLAIRPARQKCTSLRVRIETTSSGVQVTGAAMDMHVLSLSVAIYDGLDRSGKRGRR